jgi:aminobenzoyl-glutamate utilization protein B
VWRDRDDVRTFSASHRSGVHLRMPLAASSLLLPGDRLMPRLSHRARVVAVGLLLAPLLSSGALSAQGTAPVDSARRATLKREVADDVERRAKLTQEIVDMLFSFGELGFQEVESYRYVTELLTKEGFRVQRGYAGMPTAWVATWGSGKPVIALGADIDGIPQASQKPGVAYRAPLVEGAPGHGEGHNAGQALNITAALAVKRIMERDRMPGTLVLWPGVAEELVGAKAWFVREGLFKDVDAVIFSHVANDFQTGWGGAQGTGLVSVRYDFRGTSAHAAGAPWRGRSALDAVELMDVAWNFRREHLRLQSRSHSVIIDGGDQPNVVPTTASVWYYFREITYPQIRELWAVGDTIARAAAMATGTQLAGTRVLGAAWPRHGNRPIAQALQANMKAVGMPKWSEADLTLARAIQKELGQTVRGLDTTVNDVTAPVKDDDNRGGGSDDIGDVSWNVPTVILGYPANIPGLPGHNWANAIAMATPIAHKGTTAGAKAMAMTVVDLLTTPALLDSAWRYFRDVQTKDLKYQPLIRPDDKPAIEMNRRIMAEYAPQLKPYYYDAKKYRTYLEQLGIVYPTVRKETAEKP